MKNTRGTTTVLIKFRFEVPGLGKLTVNVTESNFNTGNLLIPVFRMDLFSAKLQVALQLRNCSLK